MKDILLAVIVILVVWATGTLLVTSGNTAMLDLYNWLGSVAETIGNLVGM